MENLDVQTGAILLLLAGLIVDKIMASIKNRGVDIQTLAVMIKHTDTRTQALPAMQQRIEQLYVMHDRKDQDGVYVWYIRKSLEESIDELSSTLKKQNDILEKLTVRLPAP